MVCLEVSFIITVFLSKTSVKLHTDTGNPLIFLLMYLWEP